METLGISTGTNLAAIVQSAATDAAASQKQPEKVEKSHLSKLERHGADHPLTKFLGGFWAQRVDTFA
jgi:hypothetical protein